MNRRVAIILSLSLALTAVAKADPTLLGPSAYLALDNTLPGAGTAVSPFNGLSFSYFHLENFEDHLFNTPGVSASAGGVTSVVFGPSVHDSVDADDGVIDGSGLLGDSFFSGSGATGILFSFDAVVLGSLPTHVGLVWTDGSGLITFQAFGPGNVLLGSFGPGSGSGFPDGTFSGTTAEDRFFGMINSAGISSIFISNSGGGIEIDHLQYGLVRSNTVPEPGTLLLLGAGVLGLAGYGRKQRGRQLL
jgi:hypothetical protein